MSSLSISVSVPPALYIPAICLCQWEQALCWWVWVHSELQGMGVHGTGGRCEDWALGWWYKTVCLHVPLLERQHMNEWGRTSFQRWWFTQGVNGETDWNSLGTRFCNLGSYTGYIIKVFCVWYELSEHFVNNCWLNPTIIEKNSPPWK